MWMKMDMGEWQPLPLRYKSLKCSNYFDPHPVCWKFTYFMCAGTHQPAKIRPTWITSLFELLSKINTLRTFFQKTGRRWEITLSNCMNSSCFTCVHTHTHTHTHPLCNPTTFSSDGFTLPPLDFYIRWESASTVSITHPHYWKFGHHTTDAVFQVWH